MVPEINAEIGYEFIDGLTGYIEGYYYIGSNLPERRLSYGYYRTKYPPNNYGSVVRLTYDWYLNSSKGILKIFDKCGLEVGARNDRQKGTVWYLSANIRVSLLFSESKAASGISRHMIDLVHRDIDVISRMSKETKHKPIFLPLCVNNNSC